MASDDAATGEWPDCRPGQVRVMLLGTYHMDNPGLDEVNLEADDVLAEPRQAELRALVDSLAEWEPDRIAVERPHDRADELNDRYAEYHDGERAYDAEERFPAPHPDRPEPATECRSEVVQVGFRLADRLDHDRVAAVDEHPDPPETDPFADREVDSARKAPVDLPDPQAVEREETERLASSTVPEFLAWLNRGDALETNHDLMFDRGVRATDDSFGSPVALAHWYDRNIRMVHHLWRTMDPDDERVLFLVGSGHVRALRHLLTEAPMFCPVTPLDYL
ncbi:DUF5694 domain-containing protein [Halosimplex salinum]|uniref:DUF5694 domain-containing protein n=1 Tax=Halosimplex salinum TaxID=1710538 RepID=UPI000F46EF35|nr:DUF5694 domain-containing protein [Halosimplex salinum]